MDPIRNSLYNKYEQQLSPFGRKVMITLLNIKNERKNKSCKALCPPSQPCYQNRRVLHFKELSPPKSHLYSHNDVEDRITVQENIINVENVSIHRTKHSQFVSTSTELSNAPEDCITTERALVEAVSVDRGPNNTNCTTVGVDLGFDEMLNVKDIFDCVGDNIINNDINKVNNKEENQPDVDNYKIDNLENTDVLSEDIASRENAGNVKCSNEIKNKRNVKKNERKTYRKEKYTTAVKNWLKDTRPNNVNGIRTKKKTIQAQLTNRGGVMKYGKPKEGVKEISHNTNEVADVPDTSAAGGAVSVAKRKTTKQKFVCPIKLQVPVSDIKYHITIIHEANCKEFEDSNVFVNEAVFATLIFSNGCCQLNSPPSDSPRTPEGIMLHFHGSFYYFKDLRTIRDVFAQLIWKNTLICYDAKQLIRYLTRFQEDLQPDIFDVKIAGRLIRAEESLGTFSELLKFVSLSPEYTIGGECVLQNTAWYVTLLKESSDRIRTILIEEGLYELFVNIEMKILPILADMEQRGVRVDTQTLDAIGTTLMTRMKEVEAECYQVAGKSFQINSTAQVRTLLYDELKLDTKCNIQIRETICKGAKSTSEDMLRSLGELHPLPGLILQYRHLHKTHSTYVAGIAQHVVEGFVNPTWDQSAAVTGRISSTKPNLQGIPKTFHLTLSPRSDDGHSPPDTVQCQPINDPVQGRYAAPQSLNLRGAYRGGAGRLLLSADYCQLECRVLAAAARDHRLTAALASNDLFAELAALWLQRSPREVSVTDRERTKRLVYAALYGAGPRTLAAILQLDYRQVLEVIASFHRTFPSLKSFGKWVVSQCERGGGRLRTARGRTRTFSNIYSEDAALKAQAERQAVNFIIQGMMTEIGTAADVCKLAMCVCASRLAGAGVEARLLVSVHDELLWEVLDGHLHRAAAIIKSAMEGCGRECGLDMSLPVAMYWGRSWGEMEEYVPPENLAQK